MCVGVSDCMKGATLTVDPSPHKQFTVHSVARLNTHTVSLDCTHTQCRLTAHTHTHTHTEADTTQTRGRKQYTHANSEQLRY